MHMDDYDDDDDDDNKLTVDLNIVKIESPPMTSQCDSDNEEILMDKDSKLEQQNPKNDSINEDLLVEDVELSIINTKQNIITNSSNLLLDLSIKKSPKIDKHEKIIKCSICPQFFPAKSFLVEHIKNHFKTMACEFCQKTFVGDIKLNYHLKSFHLMKTTKKSTIKFNFPCVICNEAFITKAKLQSHTNEMHKSLISPAVCPYCFGQFFDRNCLTEHIKLVHSKKSENPVACDLCGRVCRNQDAVDRHRHTHFIETKEFICDFCKKGFSRKTNLLFHMRIHTGERPFKCKQCPKSFSHISGLNCHERVHTGERPYNCPFCDKCFIHSTDLRRHRRTHGNEEKRFQCKLCPAKFYEHKFLKSHWKTHSKQNGEQLLMARENISKDLAINSMVTIQMEVQKRIRNKRGRSEWK